MNDNTRRMIRTALQALAGFLAAGGLNQVWQNYISNHNAKIDPTLLFVVGLVLTGVAAWAQNEVEDRTGKGMLAPSDRKLGDQVIGTGLGAKTGVTIG